MKHILIIHTGGTIAMLENKETGDITETSEHPLADLSQQLGQYVRADEMMPFSVPSPQITPQHMLRLARIIDDNEQTYDGFVITHGTDTLEETAYFLDQISETDKPVIITGAMRSANKIGSDALYNLLSSLRTAASDNAWYKGVLVVMNDDIHTAKHVTKTSTDSIAAFQSPQYGPIGMVTKAAVMFDHAISVRHTRPVSQITRNVPLLKAYAGMNGDIVQAVRRLNPDGLVLEGLGQGNLPKQILPALQPFIDDHIPVILVSRCQRGIVQAAYDYEGGGRQLKDMGIMFAYGLTGPKARLKLLITLETTNDRDTLKRLFETCD